MDGADETGVSGLIADVVTRFGGQDGLVMSLGIASGDHLAGTSASEWGRVMAVNVRSHFLGLQARPAGHVLRGLIMLISSTAARLPAASNAPAYIASKAALGGLCAAAGREAAARGIRVNIVMPGLIDTPPADSPRSSNPTGPPPPSPRPPGHSMGDRQRRHIPPLRPGHLPHRANARCRRRAQRTALTKASTGTMRRTCTSAHERVRTPAMHPDHAGRYRPAAVHSGR